jgi:hypothetical protein
VLTFITYPVLTLFTYPVFTLITHPELALFLILGSHLVTLIINVSLPNNTIMLVLVVPLTRAPLWVQPP